MEYIHELSVKSRLVPDPRTGDWPLMNPVHAVAVTLAYIVFVLVGKRVFPSLPKFDLYIIRVLHNFAMTVINFYLVVELLRQAAKTSWYGPIVRDERGLGMASALWLFYVSKILEFNDTVIMLFRHAFSQVSFLHWYHHASVFLIWWFNIRFYPGGEAYPSAWLNSFVHVWMYSYYLFSTIGWNAWWKKYITQLQISQLSMFVVQGISLLFTGADEFKFIGLINGAYASTILVLFINFYVQSYGKGATSRRDSSRTNEKEAHSSESTNGATSPKKSRKTRKDD